ncbi:MAG: glycosyltransferase family 4 protein, partial [Sphingobium sp.]
MSRVLFVSHSAQPGGAELFLIDALRGGPAGWRAAFLSDGPVVATLARAGRAPLVLPAGPALLAIKRGSGPLSILRGAAAAMRAGKALAVHARDHDILCANSQKSLFIAAGAAVAARRPLIWILHDILTDPAFSNINRRAAVAVANRAAAAVVVNSHASGEAFVAAGGRASLVHIIHNGFDVAHWPRASEAAGANLRATFALDARPVVGLFGRMTPWKGQHVLIDALVQAPGVQALIVGGALFGEEDWATHLQRHAQGCGVADRMHFAGFRDDVPTLMAGCDIIAHASTSPEPFGRVVIEAMLTGRPVIATQGGAIASLIDHERTGLLVPPADPTALAAA